MDLFSEEWFRDNSQQEALPTQLSQEVSDAFLEELLNTDLTQAEPPAEHHREQSTAPAGNIASDPSPPEDQVSLALHPPGVVR